MNPISNVPGPVLVMETDLRLPSPKIIICEKYPGGTDRESGATNFSRYEYIASTDEISFDTYWRFLARVRALGPDPGPGPLWEKSFPGVTLKVIDVKDLPLYTYLPFKRPRFFELLSEATNPNLENLP
jgi:hypothetical protein